MSAHRNVTDAGQAVSHLSSSVGSLNGKCICNVVFAFKISCVRISKLNSQLYRTVERTNGCTDETALQMV